MKLCIKCNTSTDNPKFCSRSCAASYNNHAFPKRIRTTYHCPECDKKTQKKNICLKCTRIIYERKTLKELCLDKTFSKRGSIYNSIRSHARSVVQRAKVISRCQLCGYDKVINVCHIKDISTYNPEISVGEINQLSNLILLCPNHHWELDHDLL